MFDSILRGMFAGQPGVQYFDDPAQAQAWLQAQNGQPQQAPQQPQGQGVPQLGGMAGWFQNEGRQHAMDMGHVLRPYADPAQMGGPTQSNALVPHSNYQVPNVQGAARPFENHLFGSIGGFR